MKQSVRHPMTTACISILILAAMFASGLSAQETTGLPDTQPAPVVAEPVTDTIATGTDLPRLIEPVIAPAPSPVPAIKPYTPTPADLLEAKTIEQGGRRITYQRVEPLPVPPPPEPATPPTAAERAAFAARVAALRAIRPREVHILLGGTLYLSDDHPPRAFCRQWPVGGGEPISFWTNIDLRHLQGLGRFIGTDGTHYQFMMTWSIMDIPRTTAAWSARGRAYHPPVLPDFPNETPAAAGLPAALAGAATFIPAAGNAAQAGDLTAITELHKIYNLERPRLCAAHIARENARLAAEAALKANPPQPQDITLHYWLKTDAPQIPADPVPPTPAIPPPSPPSPAHPRRKGVRGLRLQGRTAPTTVMEDRRRPCQARKANAGKHIAIFACSTLAWLLGIAPAPAVLDVNGNGVSDAWKLDINNRQLLPANDTRATLALDDDGDGWTNGVEHAAGTVPRDSSPPRGIIRPGLRFVPETYLTEDDGSTTVVPESVVMTWSGIPGKLHTVEHSGDLAIWTPLGDSILCDGSPMEAGVIVSSSARLFLRVRIGDFDQDGDLLTDYEEHVLKTNALLTDTDSDGKDDFFEASTPTLYDPLDPDQDDDGILDGQDGSPRTNNAQASPDTAGLVNPATGQPTALLTTMAGRWDLEQIETIGVPGLCGRQRWRPPCHSGFHFLGRSRGHYLQMCPDHHPSHHRSCPCPRHRARQQILLLRVVLGQYRAR